MLLCTEQPTKITIVLLSVLDAGVKMADAFRRIFDNTDSDQSDFEGVDGGVIPGNRPDHYDSSDIEVSSVNIDDLSYFEPD